MATRRRAGTAGADPGAGGAPPSEDACRHLGLELRDEMLKVTLEEFRLTEMRFETDSRLGRELLFLVSNREWVRRTTETIDISRVAAVATTIVVDADPGYVVHEALRADQGPLWLPLVSLPPEVPSPQGHVLPRPRRLRRLPRSARWRRRPPLPPDLAVNIQVTDVAGQRVAELPQAEVRRQLAAALAETLVARINQRTEDGHSAPALGRDHQVLMAAAIAQVIAVVPAPDRRPDPVDPAELLGRGNRLEHVQRDLADALDVERDLVGAGHGPLPSALESREAQVVHAVRGIMVVVVPIERRSGATSFTVTMPSRRLGLHHTVPGHWSMAVLRIGLLVPSVHSDRVIQVQVPDGVLVPGGPRGDPGAARVRAEITVAAPQQFEQLCLITERLVAAEAGGRAWATKQLAELGVVKLDAVIQALRHHYDLVEGRDATDDLLLRLWSLRGPMDGLARGRAEHRDDLAAQWQALRPAIEAVTLLRRRLERNTASPGSMRFLAHAIDEFTLRADAVEAFVEVSVAPADPPVLDTAWLVNIVNLVVLGAVTTGLFLQEAVTHENRAEILSALLVIFPTIQAARITHPDPGLLSGMLQVPHFWLGVGTALPSVVLAAALAFTPGGSPAQLAGVIAVALQAVVHVWIMSHQRRWWRLWRPGIRMFTEYAPDHAGLNAVRTAWCRSLTNEALLLGRTAFPYVILEDDRDEGLLRLLREAQGGEPKLPAPVFFTLQSERAPDHVDATPGMETPSVNLLAVLLGSAIGRNAMFLVFRDEPAGLETSRGDGTRAVARVPLGRGRLVPVEPPTWVLDIMVGVSRDAPGRLAVADHPLAHVADATRDADLTILNVRLPAPPPPQDAGNRTWLRLRIGVPHRPGGSLDPLVRFLGRLDELRSGEDGAVIVHLREVPQMATLDATQTAPEDTFDVVLPGMSRPDPELARLFTDDQLDVPPDGPPEVPRDGLASDGLASDGPADASPDGLPDGWPGGSPDLPGGHGGDWRLLPVCAPARVGLMSRTFAALRDHDPDIRVASALSGVFNGISVIFLLCRTSAPGAAAAQAMTAHVAQRLGASDHAIVPVRDAAEAGAGGRPGGEPDRRPAPRSPRPLLKVQVRTPDRPGALQHLLLELRVRLREAIGTDRLGALDVRYAMTPIVDGHALSGRLVLSLPSYPHDRVASGSTGDQMWARLPWPAIGRVVSRGLAVGADGNGDTSTYDRTLQLSDDTVVTLELVRTWAAGAAPAGSASSTAPGDV